METEYRVKKGESYSLVIEDMLNDLSQTGENNLVVALVGDLGAGKTTFTQELAKILGVKQLVTSPTFTIMQTYSLESGAFNEFIHIDAYRIEAMDEVGPLRLETIMTTPNSVISVEWPEKIESIIPKNSLWIEMTILEGEERLLKISHHH